jgi:hypothetical protein
MSQNVNVITIYNLFLEHFLIWRIFKEMGRKIFSVFEGAAKSFRTGRLERELQMVQLSATRCNYVAIL